MIAPKQKCNRTDLLLCSWYEPRQNKFESEGHLLRKSKTNPAHKTVKDMAANAVIPVLNSLTMLKPHYETDPRYQLKDKFSKQCQISQGLVSCHPHAQHTQC